MSDEKTDSKESPDDGMIGNLDLTNGHDRALFRRAIREGWVGPRWGVHDGRKKRALERLDEVLETGDHRDIISAVKLFVAMEGQNQSDEHLEEKHARLDDGKATDAVEHYVVEMPKPRIVSRGEVDE